MSLSSVVNSFLTTVAVPATARTVDCITRLAIAHFAGFEAPVAPLLTAAVALPVDPIARVTERFRTKAALVHLLAAKAMYVGAGAAVLKLSILFSPPGAMLAGRLGACRAVGPIH